MSKAKKKEEPKVEKTVLYGFYETTDVKRANELISSQEWICKQVTEHGKYILKRIR